jgi:citrate synthase
MSEGTVQRGLEDVVALESKICFIDGKEGRLIYRGYDVRDLAKNATFEEVAYLLWYGRLPSALQLSHLLDRMRELRALPPGVREALGRLPPETTPMDALRTAVSLFASYAPEETRADGTAIGGAMHLTAVLPTIISEFHRIRQGLAPLPVRPELSHAAHTLYLLTGHEGSPSDVRALEVALILHADHELNASTFAARVTASTLSDLYSSVTSAIGTLKGPLHGGANQRVMEMLRAIGAVDQVEPVIREKLLRHERIMGFGHRVYKVEDPRATILREYSKRLGQEKGNLLWYDLLAKVVEVVYREKRLYPNLDLYSGSVYTLLGIPDDLFTPLFAAARVSGWTAHVLEEYSDLRLIRPVAEYTGSIGLPYVALADRRG